MSDHTLPPKPEDMGDQLDDEIKETVQDWAENPDDTEFKELDDRIDEKLRRKIGSWVGAGEDADWKAIGGKMDANTREAIAGWVGAEPGADWSEISGKIENRIRRGIARVVRAEPAADEAEEEARDPGWSDIGAKVERDVRGWIGDLVGAGEEANWKAIGDQVLDHVRTAVDKVAQSVKKDDGKEDAYPQAAKIEIEGEDDGPEVTSEEQVDPEG